MTDWANKILEDDPNRIKPFFTEWWPTFGTAIFGFGAICFMNAGIRRPLLAGIHQHVIATAVAGYVGNTVDKWRDSYLAERDAVLRHYVSLHPEDFPEPERKTYAEVLQSWVPVR